MTTYVKNFASGVTVPAVNPIDFKDIFSNFSARLAVSPTVLGTILGITALYVLLAIWARRADKKDVEKVPLLIIEDQHSYER